MSDLPFEDYRAAVENACNRADVQVASCEFTETTFRLKVTCELGERMFGENDWQRNPPDKFEERVYKAVINWAGV